MRLVKDLKKGINNSLKEIQENTAKQWKLNTAKGRSP